MYRPFVFTCLMVAPLLAVHCGCGGGSTQVAQSPADAAIAAARSEASAPADSGRSMAPPSDDTTSEPPSDATADSGAGAAMGMGGYGAPDMSGYGQEGSAMQGMEGMSSSSGMGGMGMGMGAPPPDPSMQFGAAYGAMGGGAPAMGYGGAGMEGMAGMGGMGGGQFAPPEDPAPAEDADYLAKGRYAFSIGKEKEAIEYARAFAVAAPEGDEVLQKTKWFTAGLRPAAAVRFAVGVVLEAPATMTDFKPIGTKQLQGGGTGGGRDGMMGMGSSGAAVKNTKTKEHALYDLTGSFGEAVINGFQERWTAGNFGTVFNDVEKYVAKQPVDNNAMGMMGMMGMGGMRGGPPGGAMEGMGMEGMAGMGGMPGDGQTASRPRIMPGSVVVPGMVYIGTSDKQTELMKKAEERGVDALFIFDVTVSPPNRLNGIVQNEARVRVVSMKGDNLGRSSELLNTKVERAEMSASGDDEVAKATEKFYAQFDDKVKLTDLPPLKPEHAKARLVQVLSNAKVSALEKLFEVSLYHSKQLITDEEKMTACLIVMEGSAGESVANGRPEDKQAVLDALLPNYK